MARCPAFVQRTVDKWLSSGMLLLCLQPLQLKRTHSVNDEHSPDRSVPFKVWPRYGWPVGWNRVSRKVVRVKLYSSLEHCC